MLSSVAPLHLGSDCVRTVAVELDAGLGFCCLLGFAAREYPLLLARWMPPFAHSIITSCIMIGSATGVEGKMFIQSVTS